MVKKRRRMPQLDFERWSDEELQRLKYVYDKTPAQKSKHHFYLHLSQLIGRTPGAVMWALANRWGLNPKVNYTRGES